MVFPLSENSNETERNNPLLSVHSLGFKENRNSHLKKPKRKLQYPDNSDDHNFNSSLKNMIHDNWKIGNDILHLPNKVHNANDILNGIGSFISIKKRLHEIDDSAINLNMPNEEKLNNETPSNPKSKFEINQCGLFSNIQPLNMDVSLSTVKYDQYSFPEDINNSYNSTQFSQNVINETQILPKISPKREIKVTINENPKIQTFPKSQHFLGPAHTYCSEVIDHDTLVCSCSSQSLHKVPFGNPHYYPFLLSLNPAAAAATALGRCRHICRLLNLLLLTVYSQAIGNSAYLF